MKIVQPFVSHNQNYSIWTFLTISVPKELLPTDQKVTENSIQQRTLDKNSKQVEE
jgi:hypothetical protein